MAMLPLKNKVQETFCDRQQTSTGFERITARKSGFGATAWAPGAKIRRMQQTCPVYMQNTPLVIQPTLASLPLMWSWAWRPQLSLSVWLLYVCCAVWHGDWLVTMEWVMDVGWGAVYPVGPQLHWKAPWLGCQIMRRNWIKMSFKTSKFGTSNSKRFSTD